MINYAIAGSAPLRRLGRDDDMAGIAVFLASRAGSYLTGAIIPVDGGIATTASGIQVSTRAFSCYDAGRMPRVRGCVAVGVPAEPPFACGQGLW